MPRMNGADSGPRPPREPRHEQQQTGPETGLDTKLQQKSKVHPGYRARAGLVARLMARLRQGLKTQGRDETGLLGKGYSLGENV